jgi:hypothetical protein
MSSQNALSFTHTAPPTPGSEAAEQTVLRVHEMEFEVLAALLARFDLVLHRVPDGVPIPGSFWGDPEAGVIAHNVYVRGDTPVHSMLHEACHLIVLTPEARALVHTDATDSDIEEDAACYLQVVLADELPGVGRARLMADMDAWGYSFRMGSTQAWMTHDAQDARSWLAQRGLPH